VILRLVAAILLLIAEFLLSLVSAEAVSRVSPTRVVRRSGLGLARAKLVNVTLHARVILVVGLVLLEVSGLIVELVGQVL
jgi:hypothetical protein